MKTKIIYISGNEIFKMEDIRAAFEEVRNALNLDKNTILFGVPVDKEDTGLSTNITKDIPNVTESVIEKTEPEIENEAEIIITTPVVETRKQTESEIEQPMKKRGRPRKEDKIEEIVEEVVIHSDASLTQDEPTQETDEQIVPILSVLATKKELVVDAPPIENKNIEIISEDISKESTDPEEPDNVEIMDDDEAKLEKLLSAMKPLEEDVFEESFVKEEILTETSDNHVDATLEQLATEFIETQDKIATESKSTSRSKIGKLRNILPFKQAKHKEQGLGDLFGWAGIAANDEDFSVPGFFTSAASKK